MFQEMKRAESFARTLRPYTTKGVIPLNQDPMIYFVSFLLNDIFVLGKDFPWERPCVCPRCGNYRLWGHGFVQRYFRGFPSCLFLKCYRCPSCRCVLTLRPDSHFPRIRTSKAVIREHIAHREEHCRWPRSDIIRSNLRYWWKNLIRRTAAFLDNRWDKGFAAAFDRLHDPVSRLR